MLKEKLPVIFLLIALFSCDPNRHHIEKEYDNEGNLKLEIEFKGNKPHGYGKQYYPDGKLYKSCNFTNGKLHGKSITYFKSGKVESEENYIEGKRDGLSLLFYENGNKMGENNWSNGRIISGGSFTKDGDSISVQRGNVIRTYDSSGKILVLDCLEDTHKLKIAATIKFSNDGKILNYKGPLTCLTKRDTVLLDAQNPEWRYMKTNF